MGGVWCDDGVAARAMLVGCVLQSHARDTWAPGFYAENTGNMAVCGANARSYEKGSRWPHALAAKSVFNAARAWCASVCRGLGEGPSNSSAARALRHCTVRLKNHSACKTLLELVNEVECKKTLEIPALP